MHGQIKRKRTEVEQALGKQRAYLYQLQLVYQCDYTTHQTIISFLTDFSDARTLFQVSNTTLYTVQQLRHSRHTICECFSKSRDKQSFRAREQYVQQQCTKYLCSDGMVWCTMLHWNREYNKQRDLTSERLRDTIAKWHLFGTDQCTPEQLQPRLVTCCRNYMRYCYTDSLEMAIKEDFAPWCDDNGPVFSGRTGLLASKFYSTDDSRELNFFWFICLEELIASNENK